LARVVIAGYYGYDNAGDEAIAEAVVYAFRTLAPGVHITVLSGQPARTRSRLGVDSVARFSPTAVARALARCHLFVFGGGSLLQDVTSFRSLLYYQALFALALALGFREVDRVYFSDGRRAAAAEMASELGLAEVSPSLEGVPGVMSDWAWVPSGLYRGKAYGGRGLLLLDTDPPFFARGDAEGYRRLSRERSSGAEELIVYELRRA